MVKIIYQQVTEDGKFVLGLEGLSSDTKPTGGVIADGSTFKETNTDAVYYLDTTWKLAKAGQLKELPTVSAGDNGKVMKVAEGAWGLGTDSALPEGFPAEGVANANKFIGFDASGDYAALTAPSGGAEKFVVTLTYESDTWTADESLADIVEAYEAGQIVVCSVGFDVVAYEIPCAAALALGEGAYAAIFGGVTYNEDVQATVVKAQSDGVVDEWRVDNINLIEELPSYSSDNNGQVLGVDDGDLAWVDVAPLIVTMSDENSSVVGDKTFLEIHEAYTAGRSVVIAYDDGQIDFTQAVVASAKSETVIGVSYYDVGSTSIVTSGGAYNDYFVPAST